MQKPELRQAPVEFGVIMRPCIVPRKRSCALSSLCNLSVRPGAIVLLAVCGLHTLHHVPMFAMLFFELFTICQGGLAGVCV